MEIFDITAPGGLAILTAYLVGGISGGYLMVRMARGIDVRSTGSGGTGATNVGRILGRPGFYLTLAADLSKAALAVYLVRWLNFPPGVVGAAAVAVIAGHVWPVWLGFRGGKGIASSLGAYLALDYIVFLVVGVALVVVYLLTRSFLKSWILAVLATPLLALLLDFPATMVLPLAATAAIVVYAHRDNIRQEWSPDKRCG